MIDTPVACPGCAHPNPGGNRFCGRCGSALVRECAACGASQPPGNAFCGACGKPLTGAGTGESRSEQARTDAREAARTPADPERRQLTVLFCDLADSMQWSTRLDPEELSALMQRYHAGVTAVIARYDGFVAQHLGDGVLAYFGYPQAHEDDAARALHAGLAVIAELAGLRDEMRRALDHDLVVRIGVHTGLVVVGAIGAAGAARQEQLALGEAPNLAARLQGIAAPNTVVASDTTRRLAGGTFRYEDLGEQALKGVTRPLRVWRVVEADATTDRFAAATQRHLTPLVGRSQEIGLLFERWQLAREGDGQVVLLAGQPGIGKSRTMNTFREKLGSEVRRILRFQCSPYHAHSAYHPLIVQLTQALEVGGGDPVAGRLDRLDALIQARCALTPRAAQVLARLLGLPEDGRYPMLVTTPQRDKEDTLQALLDLTSALANEAPTLFLFEDAHWADSTSLEFLDLLVARVARLPLLVIVTHRPEFRPSWGQHAHVAALPLARLNRRQSADAIQRAAGDKTLPDTLTAEITEKSDGIPLYLEELTRSVLESGQLRLEGNRFVAVSPTTRLTVPDTLRDSLMARLDRIPDVKALAQVAAVIGRDFSVPLLAEVAAVDEATLTALLNQLEETGLAFRRAGSGEPWFTFKHALVRDAAYDSLLKRRRQELHCAIAEAIARTDPTALARAPEVLARHFTAAALPEKAVPLWIKAGELAMSRMAGNEAIQHLEAGLEMLGEVATLDDREGWELELRVLLSGAYMVFEGWQSTRIGSVMERALALAQSRGRFDLLSGLYYQLYANLVVCGRAQQAYELAQEAHAVASSAAHSGLRVTTAFMFAVTYYLLGEWHRVEGPAADVYRVGTEDDHREIVRTVGLDTRHNVQAYVPATLWVLGRVEDAKRFYADHTSYIERDATPFMQAFWFTMGALFFDWLGEPATLKQYVERAMVIGRDHSLPLYTSALGPYVMALSELRMARSAQTLAAFEKAIAHWEATGAHIVVPYMKAALAEETLEFGDPGRAIRWVTESLDQMTRSSWRECAWLPEAIRVRGRIEAHLGDTDKASKSLQEALDVAQRQHAKSWALRAAMDLATLHHERGDTRTAQAILEPVYATFTQGFGTRDLQRAAGMLESLRPAGG